MRNGKLCCSVTGASGYVGTAIVQRLRATTFDVVEVNRSGQPSMPGASAIAFELGKPIAPGTFAGVDVLIHAAYDFNAHSWKEIERANIAGSKALFAAAHADGVQRIVLISTISAFPGCRSLYGRAKLEIEADAARYGAAIVRPGLVYDSDAPRGVVGALAKVLERSPIVPLVGGKSIMYPCHIDDLTQLIYRLCVDTTIPAGTPIIAASKQGMTFKAILQTLARERGKTPVFVPVPAFPLLAGLRVVEALGVRSRLRSDSLVSLLKQSTTVNFHAQGAVGVPFRGLVGTRVMSIVDA
jgi:nucleoside-diphosphate-sugar epimerase